MPYNSQWLGQCTRQYIWCGRNRRNKGVIQWKALLLANFDFNGTQVEMAIHLGILPTGYEISAAKNGIVRECNTIFSIECGSTEDFRMRILLLGVLNA